MRIPDKLYEILKWVLMIVVPAFITLLTALTKAWSWDIPLEAITITITSIAAFLGVCVGISTANYRRDGNDS